MYKKPSPLTFKLRKSLICHCLYFVITDNLHISDIYLTFLSHSSKGRTSADFNLLLTIMLLLHINLLVTLSQIYIISVQKNHEAHKFSWHKESENQLSFLFPSSSTSKKEPHTHILTKYGRPSPHLQQYVEAPENILDILTNSAPIYNGSPGWQCYNGDLYPLAVVASLMVNFSKTPQASPCDSTKLLSCPYYG